MTVDNRDELPPLSDPQWQDLARQAQQIREYAYAPYSQFRVGAALLAKDGRVFTGVNVENTSYGLTVCAERSAVCTAIGNGVDQFIALVVATSSGALPCGACRQFLFEWGGALPVRAIDDTGEVGQIKLLSELLPEGFRLR